MMKGNVKMQLSEADQSGKFGYTLSFEYQLKKDDPEASIEYTNIDFSGPGSWQDYSAGGDYPYSQMLTAALVDAVKAR